jgi:hypothetical protein
MAQDKETKINLGITKMDLGEELQAELVLKTAKHYNCGLKSSATVFWVGFHRRQHAFGLAGGGDFSETILITKNTRATQKAIDSQHTFAFNQNTIEALTQRAKDYYSALTQQA